MFWLWLIGAAILFAISMFVLGYLDDPDKAWPAFIGSLLWPIVLTASPFVVFYYLGNRKRLQKEKSTTNK